MTNQYRMADRLCGGRLAEIISEMRAEGQSYEDISRHLAGLAGIELSSKTISRWADLLGKEEPAA